MVSDDIVTRPPHPDCFVHDGSNAREYDCTCELRFETERLRAIIQDIVTAVTDEGRKPGYHKQQANYLRTLWNPLWQAISKAVREVGHMKAQP